MVYADVHAPSIISYNIPWHLLFHLISFTQVTLATTYKSNSIRVTRRGVGAYGNFQPYNKTKTQGGGGGGGHGKSRDAKMEKWKVNI